jgi:hypothetical protein
MFGISSASTFAKSKNVMYNTAYTDFSFDHISGIGTSGSLPIYNTYNFAMNNWKGITVIDMDLTLPLAMSRLGGFTFGLFILAWILMYFWNYFNSNSMLIHTMIHFAGA